jgi:lysophospholipase L1-like esterase
LGAEHTQIAQGGACLVATADGCVGMETGFLRTGAPSTSPAWDFTRYQPDAVVINLGTNDVGHHVSTVTFQAHYEALLRLIRQKYPQAHIFALQTFKDRYTAQTRAAVNAVRAAGDAKVTFIPTTGWITAADTVDGLHPNDVGHQKIAARLAPLLRP